MAGRGISMADWENWKNLIFELYIIKGWTLDNVTPEIQRLYGVKPSKRQCKQRIKRWGFDCKRIPKHIWVALHVVDSHHQQRCKFEIGVRHGYQTQVKRPEDIRKQMARYRNHPPESLHMSLADAQKYLDQFGARVIDIHDSPQTLPTSAEDEDEDNTECSEHEESDSLDSGNETSTVNEFAMLHVASALPSPSRDIQASGNSFQAERSLELRLAPLNMSPASSNEDGSFSASFSDAQGSSHRSSQRDGSSEEILDFTAELDAIDATYNGYVRYQRTQGSMSDTNEGAKHDALHFVSCYVRNSAPINEDFAHNDEHQDRIFAQKLLQHMLHRNNRHLPGALNYLTMIMHANANFQIYFTFLLDSWNVVKSDPPTSETVLATFIVFLCKFAGDDRELAEAMSHTQIRLTEWSQRILTPAEFQRNVHRLLKVYRRDSSPFIIMRYQYAWSQLEAGQDDFALNLLVDTVKHSQHVLGPNHLITINGLAMWARALEKFCLSDKAAGMYEDCIWRLDGVPKPLMPYRVRMQARLARVYIQQGNLKGAETILLQALNWRKDQFGMLNPRTWDIVENLTEVYQKMLGKDRAKAFYVEQQELHNAAFWHKQETKARQRQQQEQEKEQFSQPAYTSESSTSFRGYGRLDASNPSTSFNRHVFGRL